MDEMIDSDNLALASGILPLQHTATLAEINQLVSFLNMSF